MTYSLFLLAMGIPGATEVTNLAALCVVTSIIAHGLTDTPGANWIGRVAATAREKAQRDGQPVPPDAIV
jgi:NhaP-type Na+/H+ or K+/H+ antiporter